MSSDHSTGIGYATVKHLARKGAKVYMAARNKARAEAAIAKLQREGLGPGNGEVVWLELDLCDPRNSKKAAQEFMNKEDRLDVLSTFSFFFFFRFGVPWNMRALTIVSFLSP